MTLPESAAPTVGEGERLPAAILSDTEGRPVSLGQYRGSLSLALFLAGDGTRREWLGEVAALEADLRAWGAQTMMVVAAAPAGHVRRDLRFQGVILVDPEGSVHRRLGAMDKDGRPRPALLIADRVGVLRHRLDFPATSAGELTAVVDWARYLGIQEPECGTCVPAWSPELMDGSAE
jgi:hypothetical protein